METNSQHLYVFRITRPAHPPARPVDVVFDRGVVADSHAQALNAAVAQEAYSVRAELLDVRPDGDGCGDLRCSVCYPSSRNRG